MKIPGAFCQSKDYLDPLLSSWVIISILEFWILEFIIEPLQRSPKTFSLWSYKSTLEDNEPTIILYITKHPLKTNYEDLVELVRLDIQGHLFYLPKLQLLKPFGI